MAGRVVEPAADIRASHRLKRALVRRLSARPCRREYFELRFDAQPPGTAVAGSAGIASDTAANGGLDGCRCAGRGKLVTAARQIGGDAGHTVHNIHDRTLRQTAVEPGLLARTDAAIRSIGYLATLAGAGIGGGLDTAFGAGGVLALAAGVFALAAVVAALSLARRR